MNVHYVGRNTVQLYYLELLRSLEHLLTVFIDEYVQP